MELLLEMKIVVIYNREDGKRSVCKKCAWKIVNRYQTFTELREVFAAGKALDDTKDSAPRTHSRASPRDSFIGHKYM